MAEVGTSPTVEHERLQQSTRLTRYGSTRDMGPTNASFPQLGGTSGSVVITSPDAGRRYVRRGFIAKGSYKVVYHAYDEEEGIEVAWNEIDTTTVVDFSKVHREVQLLQSLNHPHIIRCHATWLDEERRTLVFITELMTSGTLADFISQQSCGSLKIHVMVKFCRQILSGLAYLARQDIIHRDLKASNIFINGHKGEVKIGDLGLSTASRAANSVLGTPEYMAPEIYEENYTNAVDIWSFGMCMLQMVSGVHPYQECQNVAQIFKKVTSGILPESKDAVTDPLVKEVIFKCLNLDPKKRPTAEELLNHPLFKEKEEEQESHVSEGDPPALVEGPDSEKDSASQPKEDFPMFTNALDWIKAGPLRYQQLVAQLALEQHWLDLSSYQLWREWHTRAMELEPKIPSATGALQVLRPKPGSLERTLGVESPESPTLAPSPTHSSDGPPPLKTLDELLFAPMPAAPPKQAPPPAERSPVLARTQSTNSNSALSLSEQEKAEKKKAAHASEQKLLAQMFGGQSLKSEPPLESPPTLRESQSLPVRRVSADDPILRTQSKDDIFCSSLDNHSDPS